jgi:secreted trypsin-like serine protease
MKTLMWTLVACSLAACAMDEAAAQDDNPTTSTDELPIIGGTTDTGHPCVVAVFAHAPGATSGSLCTGTVIGPHTVLTAAHCVSPATVGTGQVFEILSGTTLTLPGIVASSTTFNAAWNPNNLFGGHDIGIVHTPNPMPFPIVVPAAVNLSLPVTLVGYGSNTHTNAGVGTKRQVTTGIDAFNTLLIQDGNSNMQTCHGDSGGPAFQTVNGQLRVVGVTSFGSDPSPTDVCEGGGFHVRTDADAAFINANTN